MWAFDLTIQTWVNGLYLKAKKMHLVNWESSQAKQGKHACVHMCLCIHVILNTASLAVSGWQLQQEHIWLIFPPEKKRGKLHPSTLCTPPPFSVYAVWFPLLCALGWFIVSGLRALALGGSEGNESHLMEISAPRKSPEVWTSFGQVYHTLTTFQDLIQKFGNEQYLEYAQLKAIISNVNQTVCLPQLQLWLS